MQSQATPPPPTTPGNQMYNLDYQALSKAVSTPKSASETNQDIADIAKLVKGQGAADPVPSMSTTDLLSEIQAPAKPSADTPINPETNEPAYEQPAPAPDPPAPGQPAITEVAAKEKAKRWIQFRDLLQSRGFAFAAGNIDDYEKFQLKQWEIDWLVDAYAAYMQELGYIPKWLDLVLAELTILSPRCFDAWKMRKLKKENDALKHKLLQMEAYNRVLKEEQQRQQQPAARTIPLHPNQQPRKEQEQQQQVANGEFIQVQDTISQLTPETQQQEFTQAPQSPVLHQAKAKAVEKIQGRPDYKKYWLVDDNFYFINDTSGQYLPQEKRKERVNINSDTYPLLTKHNDQNKIDGLLNS